MTGIPDVSVVMSVCNGALVLHDTVRSVLSQEGMSLEFVIVDDGSTDDTSSMLQSLAREDSRVRVISQPNQGITVGLIAGCAVARGRYVARQDAGDVSLPDRLRAQAAALDTQPGLAFVSCWTETCGPRGEFLSVSKGSGIATRPVNIISEDARYGVSDGPAHHGSVMFRREQYLKVGGYRRQFYFGQDWDLWYRLAEVGTFQMIGRVLYRACVTPISLSGRHRDEQQAIARHSHAAMLRRRSGESEDDALMRAQAIRPGPPSDDAAKIRAKGLYAIGEQLRRLGDPRSARYFRESIAACPTFLKPRLRLAQLRLQRRD